MKLISEEVTQSEFLIEQNDKGQKDYKINGIFLQSNIKNRNGRIYPKEVLDKEVTRYNKEFINKKENLEKEIENINKNLTKIEKIKKYFITNENFTIENGMMTPTLKLKRFKIINSYKKEFENLY